MLALIVLGARIAHAQTNGVTAGELVVEPPTLISLGFEWYVEGDANRNASVAVEYRAKTPPSGAAACRFCGSMPSARSYGETLNYTAPNMFAGSLFDLEEDTLTRFG